MERVTIAAADGVAHVRLNRPDRMNALDPAMFDGIAAALDRLAAMPDLRCAVLSGEGRAFCAGLDMAAMAGLGANPGGAGTDLSARTRGIANGPQHAAWGWRALGVPVIAAVHGVAYGGGLQLMAGADVRVVAADARLSVRELHWGLVPDMAGFALWRGCVRDDALREAVYTARVFDGAEAVATGFATRVADDPVADALALAGRIAGHGAAALRAAKRLANLAADADAGAILAAESAEQAALLGSAAQRARVRDLLGGGD